MDGTACNPRPTCVHLLASPYHPSKGGRACLPLSPMDDSVLIAAAPLPWCPRRMGRTRLCEKTWEKFNEPELPHRL